MYNVRELVGYIKTGYEANLGKLRESLFPTELEFAVAGAPNIYVGRAVNKALENYSFNNVERFFQEGGNVTVVRSGDKKAISLHPSSVQHDAEGYVRQVLANHGVRPGSSTIKKIAGLVEKLKSKK